MKSTNPLFDSFNSAHTTNGAKAFASTNSALLDLFARGGSARKIPKAELCQLVDAAWCESPKYTIRLACFIRDARGGYGERDAFRTIIRHLAETKDCIAMKRIVPFIPEYGRFDDLLTLFGTPCELTALNFIAQVLICDLATKQIRVKFGNTGLQEYMKNTYTLHECDIGKSITLLGKWLPSINASNLEARSAALRICRFLGINCATYRKMCSALRVELDLVENNLRLGSFSGINYEKVPSLALLKYRKVFKSKSPEYAEYLEAVSKGEKKINTSVTTPYDIIHQIRVALTAKNPDYDIPDNSSYWCDTEVSQFQSRANGTNWRVKGELKDETLIQAWKNLPDYICGNHPALAVCDVSGSMFNEINSIDVALSLTLYLAERNTGAWAKNFFTFDDDSQLVTLHGKDIYDRVANLGCTKWGGSTNVMSTFDNLLTHAVMSNIAKEDMPEKIIIISDMQFNPCGMNGGSSAFDAIRRSYSNAGYEVPQLVFWNTNAEVNNQPVTRDENGVILVSGYSASLFKFILSTEHDVTPESFMLSILDGERYVKVAP